MPKIKIEKSLLEEALSYLEGLEIILEEFHVQERGKDETDRLVVNLENLGTSNWEPIRYQHGPGQGWHYLHENISQLRGQLKSDYENQNHQH